MSIEMLPQREQLDEEQKRTASWLRAQPSPYHARKLARETDHPILDNKGRWQDGKTAKERKAEHEVRFKKWELMRAIEALAQTAFDPIELVGQLDRYQLPHDHEVAFPKALSWLRAFVKAMGLEAAIAPATSRIIESRESLAMDSSSAAATLRPSHSWLTCGGKASGARLGLAE